jgi:class 3 adenylate cyclase
VTTCPSCGKELPPGDFPFCPFCAAPLETAPAPREQRKTVTILFCDVTGSTALGESTDPETLRALLARYFEGMKAIIESHEGTVEKFIGDAVMAVFGVPQPHEDDALRAPAGRRSRCVERCPSSASGPGSASRRCQW